MAQTVRLPSVNGPFTAFSSGWHGLRSTHTLSRLAWAGRLAGLLLGSSLALGTAPTPALAQNQLPALGDASSEGFDILSERRLGDRIMRDIRRDPDYLDDPQLSEYLDALWQPLLRAARQRGEIDPDLDRAYGWEVFQVRDRTVNAFALPGGFVGVHLGLIALTTSGDELASVLAHEMTHVTQRHIARSMENSQRQSTASMAAMLLGILVATRSATIDGAQALIVGGQAAAMQGQLNFSREMEREADRIGLQVLGSAGFAPGGMAAMFEKLEGNSRLNDSNQYPYLRSHPLTIERISEARLRAQGAPTDSGPASLALHALQQVRARVLMDRSEPALRRQQQAGAPGSPAVDTVRLGNLYGAAVASALLREYEQAEAFLDAGLALGRGQYAAQPAIKRVFDLLRLQVVSARDPAAGVTLAQQGPLAHDPARPALLMRAQAALAQPRQDHPAADALQRAELQNLQTWVVEHRRDVLVWQALSQLAEAQGLHLRSLRAAAEVAAAQGDVVGAVDRFRAAQQAARAEARPDYIEVAIVQARLRELEAEKRRWLAEQRGERVD